MDALREHLCEDLRQHSPAERLRRALDLMRLGLAMQRQTLRRRYPDETEAEIDARFAAWQRARD